MMQVAPVSIQGLSTSELVTAAAALFSMALNWRFAASISGMKLEIKQESEALRRDMLTQLENLRRDFVPRDGDADRRANFERRFEENDREITKNRESIHDVRNKLLEVAIGPLQSVNNTLADMARRLAEVDHRGRYQDEQLRELESRITDCEKG